MCSSCKEGVVDVLDFSCPKCIPSCEDASWLLQRNEQKAQGQMLKSHQFASPNRGMQHSLNSSFGSSIPTYEDQTPSKSHSKRLDLVANSNIPEASDDSDVTGDSNGLASTGKDMARIVSQQRKSLEAAHAALVLAAHSGRRAAAEMKAQADP